MNDAGSHLTVEEYIDFDDEIFSFYPQKKKVYCKTTSIQEYVNEQRTREQQIKLDSEADEKADDIEDEQESVQVTPREALLIMDCLMHTNCISDEDQIDRDIVKN